MSGQGAGIDRAWGRETVTISSGGTTSGKVDGKHWDHYGLVLPAAFTGASITFTVSADDGTYQALYDITGAQVSVTVTQGRSYDLPQELTAWPFWKIVSASSEGADRSLVVLKKG